MAVVERLDVSRFESIKAREGKVGRDATNPRLLIASWLYASVRGIGSARELARRCDFPTNHGKALDDNTGGPSVSG